MTDESVDCFNCGSANPEWAQVCRSCGVVLRHGEARVTPTGRVPTDRDSLVSIGAVVGTILLALLVGLFVSSLNPTVPAVGQASPSPSATPDPSIEPTVEPIPTDTPAPTPLPTPALAGTIAFGTGKDANQQVTGPTDTFSPGTTFAHAIAMTVPFGVDSIAEQIVRINDDGTEEEVVPADAGNSFVVDPAGTQFAVVCCDAVGFIAKWGPGLYEMRVFGGEALIARGQFRLTEG